MQSHYCPNCGKTLVYKECRKETRWGYSDVFCPDCDTRAEHSVGLLITVGLIVAFVGALCISLNTASLAVGGGLFVVGLFRLFRRHFRSPANRHSSQNQK
jgi:ssDNA-binding Zn-finger/Zn-ribbon topoisomerase 1